MHQASQSRPARTAAVSERAGLILLWAMLTVCMVMPCVGVLFRAAGGISGAGLGDMAINASRAASLCRTAFYAGLIATLATLLAWPAALVAARARGVWLLALATPMLLPSYLAYAGWSIARAPTTPLGLWIAAAPEHGLGWLPHAASRSLAVWGLALWAWPLAAVVIAMGLRSTGSQVAEPLRLERCTGWQRWRTTARAAWPSVVAGWGLVALLMLGSAVPLHVARVETYAIRVWMALDEHPADPWRAWLVAWPLVLIAGLAGGLVSGRLARAGRRLAALAEDNPRAHRPSVGSLAWAAAPWVLAVVVPFGLFWSTMGGPGAIARLFGRAGAGLATSAAVGLVVGLLAMALCLASAQTAAAARGQSRGLRLALGLALAWALLPGVLVGAAIAQSLRILPGPIADSAVPMVIAHLSRAAFLPVLVGAWLGASEAGGLAETRLLDGATGLANWATTGLRSALGPALAVGAACACLSFHEIESSIQVQTPGIDHMAQRLLQWLHYERMAELSAAGVLLLGVGIVVSGLVVIAAVLPRARTARHTHR